MDLELSAVLKLSKKKDLRGGCSALWTYLIAVIVVILDQLSKWWIVVNLELYESISVIGNFFQLTSHRNRGAAFGILQDQRWFFITITIVVLIGIIYYNQRMLKEKQKLLPFALSLVLGGAFGNFIDRVRMGEVVDFFHFYFKFPFFGLQVDYNFAIFNVADSAIVVGVILIFIDQFILWRKERKGMKTNEQA